MCQVNPPIGLPMHTLSSVPALPLFTLGCCTCTQMLRLIELEKNVVEGGGAIGVAALLQGLLPELKVPHARGALFKSRVRGESSIRTLPTVNHAWSHAVCGIGHFPRRHTGLFGGCMLASQGGGVTWAAVPYCCLPTCPSRSRRACVRASASLCHCVEETSTRRCLGEC
jgi:hypothetical protein